MSDYKELVRRLRGQAKQDGHTEYEAADAIEKLSAEVERWRDPESPERQKLQEEIIFSLGDGARSEVELREGQLEQTEAALALARAELDRYRESDLGEAVQRLDETKDAEIERLKQELAEARASDAESLAMYHRARDRADALQAELAEALAARETYAMTARQDIIEKAKALDELEAWLGLHQQVEMRYVVDGYEVSLSNDDGSSWEWEDASTLAAAIRDALEKAKA